MEFELYGEIGSDWWGGFNEKDVSRWLQEAGGQDITVRINSPGGDVFAGVAMLNRLRSYSGSVSVVVDGLAASAASLVAMAGDTITMGTSSFLMIHNAWTITAGDAGEHRRIADLLDKVSGEIVEAYATRVDDREQLTAWMNAETWFTGEEAVAAGLADSTDESLTASPAAASAKFTNAPAAVAKAQAERPAWQVSARSRQLQVERLRANA